MRLALVHLLFFLSGVAGLIYQVVWVRQFGNLFGNTVYSASTVSAVFLLGLGIGSYWAGRWADRSFALDPGRPLRAYGAAEIGIGLWALGLAFGMPVLAGVVADFSSYAPGPDGWYELTLVTRAGRYLLAAALLAPATLLMGATLTLLIRFLVSHDLGLVGWRVGLLFGINTAGAAVGAFLTDFALVPALGILGTQEVAVALNVAAGLGALALRTRSTPTPPAEAAEAATPAARGAALSLPVGATGAALFFTGFATIGMEILWFRYLITLIGAYRAVFSLLLTVILLGIFAGSLLGGWLERRTGRAARIFLAAQAAFVVTAILQLVFFDTAAPGRSAAALYDTYREATPVGRVWIETWYDLRPVLGLVALPALLMGFSFPLANALTQDAAARVGRSAGLLYLANTFGNVAGSLTVGFVLLPTIGMQNAVTVLACAQGVAVLVLGAALLRARRGSGAPARTGEVAAPALAVAAAVVFWVAVVPERFMLAPALPGNREGEPTLLSLSEGVNETIAVYDVPGVARRLRTNGHNMSSTSARSLRYMNLFVHLPLLQADDPESVLVICMGVGNTLHAATLHPSVKTIHGVDLSRHVVEHIDFFSTWNGDVLHDPRLEVFINDGRQHLRMQEEESYDLITLEPPPINFAGVSALYSEEFYELARSRLRPGGFMSQWIPAYQVDAQTNLAMVRAFLDVFPDAALFSGFKRDLILIGRRDAPLELDVAALERKLARNPELWDEIRGLEVGGIQDLVGTFVAAAPVLEKATEGVQPVTDDRPLMEYSARSQLFEGLADVHLPASIFDVWSIEHWCPGCLADDRVPTLRGYLTALDACYRSEAFLDVASYASRERHPLHGGPGGVLLPRTPEVMEAIRQSPYLGRLFGEALNPHEATARRHQPCVVSPAPVAATGR